TPSVQIDNLMAIADLNLTSEAAQQVLDLSNDEWSLVTAAAPATLDRVMRDEIRESGLSTARRRVPSQIMTDMSEAAAAVVVELVRPLVRPNSVFNQERTDELRERARSEVAVQTVTLERNEVIVRAGDIVTVEDVEALTHIGLIQDEWNWWVTVRSLL